MIPPPRPPFPTYGGNPAAPHPGYPALYAYGRPLAPGAERHHHLAGAYYGYPAYPYAPPGHALEDGPVLSPNTYAHWYALDAYGAHRHALDAYGAFYRFPANLDNKLARFRLLGGYR